MPSPFLTARWEDLVLLNYSCPRELLELLIPRGTTLDLWNGEAIISVVGFMFRDTRVSGWSIPFHRTFEEVNLRFYVYRTMPSGELRRAVVFIKELVPRRAIAAVARWIYNEPYVAVPMGHRSSLHVTEGGSATYTWSNGAARFELTAEATAAACLPAPGSEAEFITEHFWGYTRQRNDETLEYQVEHPSWPMWSATSCRFSGAGATIYGSAFGELLANVPRSAYVAKGSEVVVRRGQKLSLLD